MMDFSKVLEMRIPKGTVASINDGGVPLWEPIKCRYVSLGDSIAACQEPTLTWQQDYADYQYGVGGNTQTKIVPNSYTDKISNNLEGSYGSTKVKSTSFARSGDKVSDLIEKLKHNVVKNAIAKADVVTVCIGANDILGHVNEDVLNKYIEKGNPALAELSVVIEQSLASLRNGGYKALLDALAQINSNTKYVFTTIYNPYKYLHIDEGTDGFFAPMLAWIPNMGINFGGNDVSEYLREALLTFGVVQTLFSRVNAIGAWVEGHINSLNEIIKSTIGAYSNKNFSYCETKAVFDTFPNRNQGSSSETKYSDLIHTEFTAGYDTYSMDWGGLWRDAGYTGTMEEKAGQYWTALANKYAWTFDFNGLATELVSDTINRVIVPNVDPHPTITGQGVMYEVFATKLFGKKLDEYTITYYANNGTNASTSKKVYTVGGRMAYTKIDVAPNSFTHPTTGYYSLNEWKSSSGTVLKEGNSIALTNSIDLYAQWSNIYKVVYKHSKDAPLFGNSDTGPMEKYELWVAGTTNNQAGKPEEKLGAFSNSAKEYYLPYGTALGVVVGVASGDARSYITYNGTKVAGNSNTATYNFSVVGNMEINFEWTYWIQENFPWTPQSYWNCYITTK